MLPVAAEVMAVLEVTDGWVGDANKGWAQAKEHDSEPNPGAVRLCADLASVHPLPGLSRGVSVQAHRVEL